MSRHAETGDVTVDFDVSGIGSISGDDSTSGVLRFLAVSSASFVGIVLCEMKIFKTVEFD